MKRIFAIIGVIILLALYLISFISAVLAKPYASGLFMASIFCTIVIPILMYGFLIVYRYVHRDDKTSVSLKDLKKQNKEYEKHEFQKRDSREKKDRKDLDK